MNTDNMPTTVELTEAINAAIQDNCDAFLSDHIIDAEVAVDAIKAGEVRPWLEYEGDDLAESLALAIVMNDGPWWTTATPQDCERWIKERISHLVVLLPANQAAWDRLVEDEAYAINMAGRFTLEDIDTLVDAACPRILAAWEAS